MAFTNELIPEEEKAKFMFPVYTASDGSKPTLWKWTIDRDRNAYLVTTEIKGNEYDGNPETCHFVMTWQGYCTTFWADPQLGIEVGKKDFVFWRVHDLVIPLELCNQRDAVLQLISEALDARGYLYNRERYVGVNVILAL